jgi:hypothetical protein
MMNYVNLLARVQKILLNIEASFANELIQYEEAWIVGGSVLRAILKLESGPDVDVMVETHAGLLRMSEAAIESGYYPLVQVFDGGKSNTAGTRLRYGHDKYLPLDIIHPGDQSDRLSITQILGGFDFNVSEVGYCPATDAVVATPKAADGLLNRTLIQRSTKFATNVARIRKYVQLCETAWGQDCKLRLLAPLPKESDLIF